MLGDQRAILSSNGVCHAGTRADQAGYILPVVESIGYLFPFVAQTLFALAHSSDVVSKHTMDERDGQGSRAVRP